MKLGKLREKLLKVGTPLLDLHACLLVGRQGQHCSVYVAMQVLIMELGSTHDAIAEVAKAGVLLALEHNMLPKSILQEALRCG